ncbi:MAG: hypothetical protein HY390_03715 [Deltaproteobacteria bacterium]|nr:hypothetical protein [Deltaproteobacteria bacterium]
MKNRISVYFITFFFTIGLTSLTFANNVDPRETAIDLAVGGMEEGSRPLSSESGEDKIPGANLSPGMDTSVKAVVPGPGASALGSASDTGTPGGAPEQEPVSEPSESSGANLDDVTSGLEAGTTIETGPSDEGVSEPTAPDNDRSIIEADATVDTTGGTPTVDTDVSLDTSAEGGLIDADAATTADIVDQELTSDAGVQIDMGDSTTLLESTLGNEIGTSTAPPDAEADAGLEADVEGTGSGDDVAADPADGLSATPSL